MKWFKVNLWILVLLLSFSGLQAAEKPKRVMESSVIETVTVFQDRALIVRVLEKEYAPGHYILQLSNLPMLLIDESVRVSCDDPGKAKILDIKIQNERLEETANARVNELEKKQRELERQIRALDDRLQVLARKDEFLRSLLNVKGSPDAGDVEMQKKDISEWAKIVAFLDTSLSGIQEEKRRIEYDRKELTDKKAVTDHELNAQVTMRGKERKNIEIEAEIAAPGKHRFSVSYIVLQATWSPIYDLRFATDTREVGLTYQAMVRQESGEDWENVSIALSTARPASDNQPPELQPLNIDRTEIAMRPISGEKGILGVVTDNEGNPLPGVSVRLLTNGMQVGQAISDDNGNYRFKELSPGLYDIRYDLEGFQSKVRKEIDLMTENGLRIRDALEIGRLEEVVTVAGRAPLIDVKSSSWGAKINRSEIQAIMGGSQSNTVSHRGKTSVSTQEPPFSPLKPETRDEIPVTPHLISATFTLAQKTTVLSNNSPQKVTVAMQTLAVEREYLAIPKLSEQTFLKATVTNGESTPLLAGRASVFYDGSFVSTTPIPQVSANEKFKVSIGEEGGIRVKRELLSKKADESGLFNRKTQMIFEYRIQIENFHRTAETITIIDQIPVTDKKENDVKLLSVTPEPRKPKEDEAEKEKREGALKWELSLQPLEKREIRFKYSVTYPRKGEVFNLE